MLPVRTRRNRAGWSWIRRLNQDRNRSAGLRPTVDGSARRLATSTGISSRNSTTGRSPVQRSATSRDPRVCQSTFSASRRSILANWRSTAVEDRSHLAQPSAACSRAWCCWALIASSATASSAVAELSRSTNKQVISESRRSRTACSRLVLPTLRGAESDTLARDEGGARGRRVRPRGRRSCRHLPSSRRSVEACASPRLRREGNLRDGIVRVPNNSDGTTGGSVSAEWPHDAHQEIAVSPRCWR